MLMNRIVFWMVPVAMLGMLAGCAEAPTAHEKESDELTDSASAAKSEITKASWMEALPEAMSTEFCSAESSLRGCYPVSDQECHSLVTRSTVSCEQRLQAEIPNQLQESEVATWGSRIGDCANGMILQDLKVSSPECQPNVDTM